MRACIERLGLLGSASLLMACAGSGHPARLPDISADEAYLTGRTAQLARSSTAAAGHYRRALLADPRHVAARNGLATILAEQGDLTGAIALWRDLTAQQDGAAYLFSNLGYAYFLNGDYAAAQQAQQRACVLDPANPYHWQRLASTLEKAGDAARALRMQRQALALLEHDLPTDAGWARVELIQGADGLLTLLRTAPTASLEIANGNGTPGMARATARRVTDRALHVVRISNAGGFAVQRTRIEYRPALRNAAQRLAQQVQPDAVLVEATRGLSTDLRLVLGRNAKPRA
jgi:tetratricopeptide (TPR) repeat protein